MPTNEPGPDRPHRPPGPPYRRRAAEGTARAADPHRLGFGYLTLGEDTPALSGAEAQRLKLATELGRDQSGTLLVLDEPSVGLHPLDTCVLIGVLDRLLAKGATIVVIEHDLELIANADHVIDIGPGGGNAGGRIIATGTPEQIAGPPQHHRAVPARSRQPTTGMTPWDGNLVDVPSLRIDSRR